MELESPIGANYTVYTAYAIVRGTIDSVQMDLMEEQLECRFRYIF